MRKTLTSTYLKKIGACQEAIDEFVSQPERDTVKILRLLIKFNRFERANWLIVRLMNKKQNIKYAVYANEQALDILEKKFPDDDRPRKAIETAKKRIKQKSIKASKVAAYATYAATYAAYVAYVATDAAHAKKIITKMINHGIALIGGGINAT